MADQSLPLVDVSGLLASQDDLAAAAAIDQACREIGFFRITGHGLRPAMLASLDEAARTFFALAEDEKAAIAMSRGGSAWRGWFPVGGELTSGKPDQKEGIYFGTEHASDDPRVVAGAPLHGINLFPVVPAELRPAVLEWLGSMLSLGRAVMRGIGLGLGLDPTWFEQHLTADPTALFRIFHYPPQDEGLEQGGQDLWGVGEHTDYGLLTLLAQDEHGGLQVHSRGEWIEVPADPDVIICNIGDMLDRLTEGRYRSTPHRVRNTSGQDRLSFPFFFDPSWDAIVEPLPLDGSPIEEGRNRWDEADPAAWIGTYGDYLTAKVSKVFPDLFAATGKQ